MKADSYVSLRNFIWCHNLVGKTSWTKISYNKVAGIFRKSQKIKEFSIFLWEYDYKHILFLYSACARVFSFCGFFDWRRVYGGGGWQSGLQAHEPCWQLTFQTLVVNNKPIIKYILNVWSLTAFCEKKNVCKLYSLVWSMLFRNNAV